MFGALSTVVGGVVLVHVYDSVFRCVCVVCVCVCERLCVYAACWSLGGVVVCGVVALCYVVVLVAPGDMWRVS